QVGVDMLPEPPPGDDKSLDEQSFFDGLLASLPESQREVLAVLKIDGLNTYGIANHRTCGDKPPVPGENRVRFGHAGNLLQSVAPDPLSDLSKGASLGIRQAQPCWQVGAENSVRRSQVLILQKQFLVYQPSYIRQ